MDSYEKQFKENIQLLIEQGLIREAKDMVHEYEKTVRGDIELYSIKGVISIIEGDWDNAKNTLMEGLSRNGENFDLLYNLAFLYQSTAQVELAIRYYVKALYCAKDDKEKDVLYETLRELKFKKNEKTEVQENKKEDEQHFQDCEIIIKNTDSKTLPNEGNDIYSSRKNVLDAIVDEDAPLVSIYVVAYNNLQKHTIKCIQCILKYTREIDYELILVDNGSSDGTLDYFKSCNILRQIRFSILTFDKCLYDTFW